MRVLVAWGDQHGIKALVEGIRVESLLVCGHIACAMPQGVRYTPKAGISRRFHPNSQTTLRCCEEEAEPLAGTGRDNYMLRVCDQAAHTAQVF